MVPFLQYSTAPLPQRSPQTWKMAIEMGTFRTLASTFFPCARVSGRMKPAIVSACTWPELRWPGFPPRSWAAFRTTRTVGNLAPKPTSPASKGAAGTVTR